jgi:hypothetical protein
MAVTKSVLLAFSGDSRWRGEGKMQCPGCGTLLAVTGDRRARSRCECGTYEYSEGENGWCLLALDAGYYTRIADEPGWRFTAWPSRVEAVPKYDRQCDCPCCRAK